MHTVIETKVFLRQVEKLLSPEEKDELLEYLAAHPVAGDIIQGTGGIRKIRWALAGRGKRGGARVIHFYHNEHFPLVVMAIYAKNEKDDLTRDEAVALGKYAREYVATYRKRRH